MARRVPWGLGHRMVAFLPGEKRRTNLCGVDLLDYFILGLFLLSWEEMKERCGMLEEIFGGFENLSREASSRL